MAEDKEDREEGGFHNPNHNNNNNISKKGSEVKSCKGYLYYSFLRRSKNPTCVGIPRTLHRGTFTRNVLIFKVHDQCPETLFGKLSWKLPKRAAVNHFRLFLSWLLGVPEQEGLFKRSADQTSRIASLYWF
uniref:DUF8204 domain-containing protein n=1 Tax=Quercus lobata TaxID=97700 RepID=A0A7N2L4L2_QUELO